MESSQPTLEDYLAVWPNCITADCNGKACIGLNDTLCYPCATGKSRDSEGNALIAATDEEVESWQEAIEAFWTKHFGERQ